MLHLIHLVLITLTFKNELMQHIIFRCVSIIVFVAGSLFAKAQKSDSTIVLKVQQDSFKQYKVYAQSIKMDSVSRKIYKKNRELFTRKQNDSLFRKMKAVNVCMDSMKIRLRKMDTHVRLDSLNKIRMRKNIRFDSLRVNMKFKRDSAFRKSMAYQRMDSMKLKTYMQNLKMDSVKLKIHLQNLKIHLQNLKVDSMRVKMKERVITMEMPFTKDATVFIDNIGRKAIIRTTSSNKVKMQTTVSYDGDVKLNDAEWFAKMNLGFEQKEGGISIEPIERQAAERRNNTKLFEKKVSDDLNIRDNKKKALIVYVPVNAKLDIESKYADVAIENNIKYLKAEINNASLSMLNADKVVIESRSGGIKAGNIKDADLDLTNCTLISRDIDKLKINSRNSKASFENINQVVLKSTGDQYQITQAYGIEGNKNFGKMDIAKLKNNITLTGSSADVNISAIDKKAELIKIDNKYADVRLPVYNLKAYTVSFDGKNSKVFTAFQKVKTSDSLKSASMGFSATVGDVQGSHTKFQINCSNCNVDFNN